MVLEITPDCAGRDIECDGGNGVEIIARPIVADGGAPVARVKVCQICFGVVISRHPDRSAARLPFVAFRPGLTAGFARRRHGISSPQLFACFGIEGCHEAANSELSARCAHHHSSSRYERCERHVIGGAIIGHLGGPHFLAGLRMQSDENGLTRREVHLVAIERDPAIGFVRHGSSVGTFSPIAPQQIAAPGIDGDHLIHGRGDEHDAVVDDGSGFVAPGLAGGEHPHRRETRDIGRRQLVERAVTPAVISAADHQPVAIFGMLEALRRNGLILLKQQRHRNFNWGLLGTWLLRLTERRHRKQPEHANAPRHLPTRCSASTLNSLQTYS
jgi:hypothetical protein